MNTLCRVVLLEVVCCGLVTSVGVSLAQTQTITLKVSNETLHRIDPRMFGQFMEQPSWGEIGVEGALVPGTSRLQLTVCCVCGTAKAHLAWAEVNSWLYSF